MERGLDTVSRFFLSDRDARDIPSRCFDGIKEFVEKGQESSVADAPPDVCMVLCPDGFAAPVSFLGRMLALSMAAADVSVGLIETTTRLPHTFFLSGGYENIDAVFWETDMGLPEFSNMVDRFRSANDFVILNAAASSVLKTQSLAGVTGRCLVPTTVEPRDLLGAYRTVKSASKKWNLSEIELVVVKRHSADNAKGAVAVLEGMARKFLSCSVRFIGAVTVPDDMDVCGVPTQAPFHQARPDASAAGVKEIACHLILSGGLRKKKVLHAEKRI